MAFGDKSKSLYDDGVHRCLMFSELVKGSGIQSNQFLIIDGAHEALLDPGGDLTYAPLTLAIGKHCNPQDLDYILASHQDPDIIASLGRWMMQTKATVVCSRLWERFLPHLASSYLSEYNGVKLADRIKGMPDSGGVVHLGRSRILVLPAHFLHSVGNFHFYDETSRILFSGDMGASMVDTDANKPVDDFEAHVPSMRGFHQRYMGSNKACRLWADMVRGLDVEMIVPQHGRPFVGKQSVTQFLDWISQLRCGMDLLTQANYTAPVM